MEFPLSNCVLSGGCLSSSPSCRQSSTEILLWDNVSTWKKIGSLGMSRGRHGMSIVVMSDVSEYCPSSTSPAAASTQKYVKNSGYIYRGSDALSSTGKVVAGWRACADLCASITRCKSWTIHDRSGKCWPKIVGVNSARIGHSPEWSWGPNPK